MLKNLTKNIVVAHAFNISISTEINGETRCDFNMPADSYSDYVSEFDIIECDGQMFRAYGLDDSHGDSSSRKLQCCHVITDMSYVYKERFPNVAAGLEFKANVTAKEILAEALAGSKFTLFTDEELEQLGYSWVTDKTDYWVESKTNATAIVQKLIEQLGKGELFFDNYKVAIVEQIGHDNGVVFDTRINIKNLERKVNSENVVTRLYGYGADDLPPHNNGVYTPYVDSPNIGMYDMVRVGYKEYSNITTEIDDCNQKVYNAMLNDISKMDKPEVTYTVDVVDLNKLGMFGYAISLGDYIRLKDGALGIDDVQRLSAYTYYPYEAIQPSVTLGTVEKTLKDYILKG